MGRISQSEDFTLTHAICIKKIFLNTPFVNNHKLKVHLMVADSTSPVTRIISWLEHTLNWQSVTHGTRTVRCTIKFTLSYFDGRWQFLEFQEFRNPWICIYKPAPILALKVKVCCFILLSLLFVFTKWGNYLNHLNNNDDSDHLMASWKVLIRSSHHRKLYQTWSRPDQYSVNMAKGSEESNQPKSIKIVWKLTRRRLRQFLSCASNNHNICLGNYGVKL